MGLFDKMKDKKTQESNHTAPVTLDDTLVPGIGRIPFPAYRGREPYIFISYAHMDSNAVFPEIKRFNDQGYRVWYDEGISPGSEWTDEIADALSGCSLFVVMMTPHALASHNVQNEINYAIDERKPFVSIHLTETNLRGGLKLQIGTKQAILKHNMTENEYVYKYTSAFERLGIRCANGVPPKFPPSSPKITPPVDPVSSTEAEIVHQRYMTHEIERIQNSPATTDDFEWVDSSVKAYHGIKKCFTLPSRATKVMSFAFQNNALIKQVTLPNSVFELDADSFFACPNLELVVIKNDNVTFNGSGAFSLCPKLTVQCTEGSATHKNLQKTFAGNIIFLDSPAKDIPVATEIVKDVPPAASPASTTAETKHVWGDYVPKGTAYITLTDGTVYEAIANSLLCCAVGIEINAGNYQRLYPGFDNPSKDISYRLEKMVLFSDMQSVSRQEDTLCVCDYDDEMIVIHPVKDMQLWFIDGNDNKQHNCIAIDHLQSITFNRFLTPSFDVAGCILTFEDGMLSVPFSYLVFNIDFSNTGIPEMKLTTELSPISDFPLTLKRIRRLTVIKLIKAAKMYSPLTEAEIEVDLKNGETSRFTFSRRVNILALTGNGVLKSFGVEKLKSIDFL